MKKYNLNLVKLKEVRAACQHNKSCLTCPFVTEIGSCPFDKAPCHWELD